jgi:hypothetical protein
VANQGEIERLSRRMDELLYREEMMWLQRSRIAWLKKGDQNTKFFHRKAPGKKNSINLLKKDDGNITKDKKEMEDMTKVFFQSPYTADHSVCPDALVQSFEPRITDEMNTDLCKELSEEEIGDALFQMGPLKAPGSDGFPTRFFQWNWGF